MTRPQVTVNLQDKDFPQNDLDALAKEANRDWAAHEVVLELAPPGSGRLDACNVLPTTASTQQGTSAAVLNTTIDAQYTVKEIRRKGPHLAPIIWSVNEAGQPAGGAITVAAPAGSVTVEVAGRARVSTWIDPPHLWNTTAASDIDPNRIHPRWRNQSFAGLDDVTLLVTVFNQGATDEVDWAPNLLVLGGDKATKDAERLAFVSQSIAMFHKQKIQVFAGIFSDTGVPGQSAALGDDFCTWLRATVKGAKGPLKPLFVNHARKLVAFFDDRGLDIDGISYDLEIFATKEQKRGTTIQHLGLGAADRPAIEALFQAVADELAKKGRYLAYANSAFTNPTNGITTWMPYDLAKYPNVIARPMSYVTPRDKVMNFALGAPAGGVGLHPGQLQVGFATVKTPTQDKSGNTVFIVPDSTQSIATECGNLERRFRVGVVHFGFGSPADAAGYASWDAALNPGGPPPGTKGQPIQGPLNEQRIQAFKNAGATGL